MKQHKHHFFRKKVVARKYKKGTLYSAFPCKLKWNEQLKSTDYCRKCGKTKAEIDALPVKPKKTRILKLTQTGYKILLKRFGKDYLVCPVCNLPMIAGQKLAKENKKHAHNYHEECYGKIIVEAT